MKSSEYLQHDAVGLAELVTRGETNAVELLELALGQSAKVAAQGAQSVAQKQREVLEAGLREASTLAREYKPLGKVQENLALQTEFARKMFDIAVKGAQDSASTARQSTCQSGCPIPASAPVILRRARC